MLRKGKSVGLGTALSQSGSWRTFWDAYGPCANNPQGSEQFRKDRATWYEQVTGESLEDVTLTEQWIRAHKVARAFRADTRADRPRWDRYCDDV